MKPLYTLNAIDLLVRYALNYAMSTKNFSIECRAEEGFRVTYSNEEGDFFQVINTVSTAKLYTQPAIPSHHEYDFEFIDNNIYAFKDAFDTWIRCLYEKEKKKNKMEGVGNNRDEVRLNQY